MALSLGNLALLYRARAATRRPTALQAEPGDLRESAGDGASRRSLQPQWPGLPLCGLGRYAEAEPLHKRSLAIREKVLGPESPAVAQSLNTLAVVYRCQGRYAEAEPLLKRSLAIWEQQLGRSIPAWSLPSKIWPCFTTTRAASRRRNRSSIGQSPWRIGQELPLENASATISCGPGSTGRPSDAARPSATSARQCNWPNSNAPRVPEENKSGRKASRRSATPSSRWWPGRSNSRTWTRPWMPSSGAGRGPVGRNVSGGSSTLTPDGPRSSARKPDTRARTQKHGRRHGAADRGPGGRQRQDPGRETCPAADASGSRWLQARKALYEHYRDQRPRAPFTANFCPPPRGRPGCGRSSADWPRRTACCWSISGPRGRLPWLGVTGETAQLWSLTLEVEDGQAAGSRTGAADGRGPGRGSGQRGGTGVLQQLRDQSKAGNARRNWPRSGVLVPKLQREAILAGKYKHLMVVPDGKLAILPFEALVVRGGEGADIPAGRGPGDPLWPSATVLYNLGERASAVASSDREPVLTSGQPGLFGRAGGRAQRHARPGRGQFPLRRPGRQAGPLPYSGWESTWVADAFRKAGIGAVRLEGGEATKVRLQSLIEGRRIIHLACHGLADQSYGNLFGALALTAGPTSRPEEGFSDAQRDLCLEPQGLELTI